MPTHSRRPTVRSDGVKVQGTTVRTRGSTATRSSAGQTERLRKAADASANGRGARRPRKTPEERAAEIEALGAQLQQGVEALVSSDDWRRYLDAQSRFRNYSFGNQMLILMQNPRATRVAGFRAWQGMNRQVQRGETSLKILAPATYKVTVKDEATGEERKVPVVRGFTVVSVFDVSQTEGEPLPEIVHQLHGAAPEGSGRAMSDFITQRGFTVSRVPRESIGGAHGSCNHATKEVKIADDLDEAHQVKTMVHESAHMLLHETAIEDGYGCVPGVRSQAEIEAESTAYVVCSALGLPTDDYSFGYVAHWSGGDSAKVKKSMEAVNKASREILDALDGDAAAEPEDEAA